MVNVIQKENTLAESQAISGRPESVARNKIYAPAVLLLTLLVGSLIYWCVLDHHIPVWDSACHLLRGYDCADLIQAHIGFRRKVLSLLTVSSFYTPLTYYLHGLLIAGFGASIWVDVLPKIFWYATCLTGLYLLARKSFGDRLPATITVAIWATYPCTYGLSRAFALLDVPMTAMVFLSLWLCMVWDGAKSWRNACLLGLMMGLTFLTKQTAVIFLITPMLFLLGRALIRGDKKSFSMLVVAGIIGGAFFGAWAVPNYAAFKHFVAQNQSVLANQPFHELFLTNLRGYLEQAAREISIGGLAAFLAALAALAFSTHRKTLSFVGLASISAFVLHCCLNWIPQFRYLLPVTGFTAMVTAAFLIGLWQSRTLMAKGVAIIFALYGSTIFVLLSFSPHPLHIPRAVEEATGFGAIRGPYVTDQISEPYWPHPKADWGHEWILGEIAKRENNKPVSLCLLPDTKELNVPGFDYFARLHRSTVKPTSFRYWTMTGYDFVYGPEQLKNIKWYAVLKNSKQDAGREFRGSKSETAYRSLIELLSDQQQYETVGQKLLPDSSVLFLIRAKAP